MNTDSPNPQPTKEQLKRARRTALVLAVSTIISIMFLIYAFVQKKVAEKLLQSTEATQQQLLEQRNMAEKARQEAEMQRVMLVETQAALEECSKSKK